MIPFQPNQTMGIMGGLPQGGVRPFQPSRGPTSFGNRARFGGDPRPVPRGGMMMGNPFQGIGFGMGGQPQPSQQPKMDFRTPQIDQIDFGTPAVMTPTFAPQPQPGSMTEDERRMVLTTANPFSSGPDAQNPMMGNRFNQARMETGMGGIASLAPRQPTMNPFNRMGGLADLFRQMQMRSSFGSVQPPNPSQFMQPQPQPSPQRPNPFGFLGLAGIRGLGSNFANVMPQG